MGIYALFPCFWCSFSQKYDRFYAIVVVSVYCLVLLWSKKSKRHYYVSQNFITLGFSDSQVLWISKNKN